MKQNWIKNTAMAESQMGKTTVIRFIPDDKAFAKAYAEFIKRKKERGEECSQSYIVAMTVTVPRF